jgi:hypothetical protein
MEHYPELGFTSLAGVKKAHYLQYCHNAQTLAGLARCLVEWWIIEQ